MLVGLSFSYKKHTAGVQRRRRKKSSTDDQKHARRLFVFVLNLRALIYSRARLSLFCALSRGRRGKEEAQKEEQQHHRNDNRLKEEDDEEEERKRRARDDDIIVTSFSKGNSRHQKLSLHFPFRVYSVVQKIRERGQQIFYSSSL